MRLKNTIAFLLLVFASNVASAATVDKLSIVVREKGDGKPLPDVTVVIKDSSLFQRSDKSGRLEFENIDSHAMLKFVARGYETAYADVDGQTSMEFYLTPIEIEGRGVAIVADRIPQKAGKIAMSKEELEHTPGAMGDAVGALKALPGVVSAEDGGAQVYLRGSDKYDNATVVNRIPIGYLYHFDGARSTIHPSLVEDINLFLSNPPVQYEDVIGGVTDVRLRSPLKDRVHKHFDISAIESSFLVEGPVGDIDAQGRQDSYVFSGRRSYIDLILSPSKINDQFGDKNKDPDKRDQIVKVPYFYDGQLSYRHEIDRGYIDYSFFTASDRIKADLREGETVDPNLIGEFSANNNYKSYSATWHQALSPTTTLDFPLVYFRKQMRVNLGNIAGQPFFANRTENRYSLMPQYIIKSGADSEWTIGSEMRYIEVPVDVFIPPPDLGNTQIPITDRTPARLSDNIYAAGSAIYVDHMYRWNRYFKTFLGLRGTRAKVTGGFSNHKWMPRLGLEYQLSQQDLLTANLGSHVQYPMDFELVEGIGNPQLGLNEAIHRSIGLEHKVDANWDIKTELYDKSMSNLVIGLKDSEPRQFANAGEGRAYGIDIFLKRKRSHGRMGWISYSYGKTTRKNEYGENIDFDGDQPHTIKAVWGQRFIDGPFDWMKRYTEWNWSIKAEVHSGRLHTPIIGKEQRSSGTSYRPIYGEPNSIRLPTYFRSDLRLERDILHDRRKSKFYVEILNFTNHKNIEDYDYGRDLEKLDNPDIVTGFPIFPFVGYETNF